MGCVSICTKERLLLLARLSKREFGKGDVAEVGVYRGGSAELIAKNFPDRLVHLFDTFTGIPVADEHDNYHKVGDFSNVLLENVQKQLIQFENIRWHVGVFPETATELTEQQFVFVHVDCDVYPSVMACCEFFYPRLSAGGVIVFDDYCAKTCLGAKAAVDTFFMDKPEKLVLPSGDGCYVIVGEH